MDCIIWTRKAELGSAIKSQFELWSSTLNCCSLQLTEGLRSNEYRDTPCDAHFIELDAENDWLLDTLAQATSSPVPLFFVVHEKCKLIRNIQACALDFMVLPITLRAVHAAESRLRDLHVMMAEYDGFAGSYRLALQYLATHKLKRRFKEVVLPDIKGYYMCETQSLLRFESEGPYCYAFTADGKQVLTDKPIYHFEDMLSDSGFVRIHQDKIINIDYMKSWSGDNGVSITLKDDSIHPVSPRRVPLFLQAFSKWSKQRQADD
jgi:two-component system LytT family response regulator